MPEAPLRETKYGLVPEGDGWFVLNGRETRWRETGELGCFARAGWLPDLTARRS